MCAIFRPCLKNGMLKVSQIQLSHAVAAPILIGDCASSSGGCENGFVAVFVCVAE